MLLPHALPGFSYSQRLIACGQNPWLVKPPRASLNTAQTKGGTGPGRPLSCAAAVRAWHQPVLVRLADHLGAMLKQSCK